MQETSFKPKYPSRLYLVWLFMLPMEIYLLREIFLNNNRTLEPILGAIFFGVVFVVLPFLFIKRITFDKQGFTVEKYIQPAKTIPYSDVTEIGFTSIKTAQGNISTQLMNNGRQLRELMQKRVGKKSNQ